MADNKKKVREDKRRVALGQEHEREYTLKAMNDIGLDVTFAMSHADSARFHADRATHRLSMLMERLRAGFPAASKASKRRGK